MYGLSLSNWVFVFSCTCFQTNICTCFRAAIYVWPFKLTYVHVFSCMGFLLGWKCLGLQLDGLAKNVGPTEIKMDVSSFYISFCWSSFHRNTHFVKCFRLPLYFWQFWVLVSIFSPKLNTLADAHTYMLQLLRKVNNCSLCSNRSTCSYKLSK